MGYGSSTRAQVPPVAAVAALLSVTLLAGCAMGPNFKRPAAPKVQRYTHGQQPVTTVTAPRQGGSQQKFIDNAKVAADWWKLFHSPRLDKVIADALAASPSLQAARARLREAQFNLQAAEGGLRPQVSASGNVARERTLTGGTYGLPGVFNVLTGSATVSYNPDVFGAQRRTIESQQAAVDVQRYQADATYLTLLGNLVNTVIAEASTREQIKATNDILKDEERELKISEDQYKVGTIAYADVLNARSRLAATRAQLPALQQQLSRNQHQLAVLSGAFPSEWSPTAITMGNLALPARLPVSLPSQLVRQRPDILAAEAQLHQASAQIGIATANLYPSLSISASYGREATTVSGLFNTDAGIWNLGVNLLAPIFKGGTLRAQRRAAQAAYEASLADYRSTVLSAFGQVADVLRALENDAETLRAQAESLQAASEARDIVEAQYKEGRASYLQVLTAQSQYEQERIAFIQAQAQRYQDTVALFTALGGGWWNRPADGIKTVPTAVTPASDGKIADTAPADRASKGPARGAE